jgi:hypothetical protein
MAEQIDNEHSQQFLDEPCGCKAWTVGDSVVHEPCPDPNCYITAFVQAETARQGKPVEFVEKVELG